MNVNPDSAISALNSYFTTAADSQWLQYGYFSYQLNGKATDIIEPWRTGRTAAGAQLIQSLRTSQQYQLLLSADWQQIGPQQTASFTISKAALRLQRPATRSQKRHGIAVRQTKNGKALLAHIGTSSLCYAFSAALCYKHWNRIPASCYCLMLKWAQHLSINCNLSWITGKVSGWLKRQTTGSILV